MNKIKNNMCDVVRVAASTYAFVALAIMSATTAVASLPSGYVECEFIQGNGSDARIVTDYTPTPNNDKIEAVVSFPSLDKGMAIWCARGADNQVKTWTLFVLKDSSDNKYKWRFDYGTNDVGNNLTPALDTNVTYMVTAEGPTFTSSGGQTDHHTRAADYTAGGPLMLFASYYNGTGNNLGNYGKHKLYSFKVWRSGTLIHNLVPAVRESDAKKGLYDVVANKFYVGSDSFKMGDFAFFSYDEGTALHGYQSYADWLASANVGASAESFTAESELEARYRTMGESDGIALRTDWGRPLIIIVR